MKIIKYKFKESNNKIKYLINLIDFTGHPLESIIAKNKEERNILASNLATKHKIKNVLHNSGFSIIT